MILLKDYIDGDYPSILDTLLKQIFSLEVKRKTPKNFKSMNFKIIFKVWKIRMSFEIDL